MMASNSETIELLSHVIKVVAVMNMASGIPASLQMWKTGKTDGVPVLFFVVGLMGAMGMTHYGVMVENNTLIMLNLIQVLLNMYYVMSYICIVREKMQAVPLILGGSMYLISLYSYVFYNELDQNAKVTLLGSASSLVFILMNCVPILDAIEAYQKRSADFDLVMLAAGLLNGALWLIYGLLLDDVYVYAPNLPFLLSGGIKVLQLIIFSKPSQKPTKKDD